MKFFTSATAISIAMSAMFVVGEASAMAASEPGVAESPAPLVQYQSPFKDYRPLGDDRRIPWRAASDEVGKIGGWRVYLREAQENNKAAPAAAFAAPVPLVPPANPPIENKPKPMHDHGQPK